MRFKRFQPVFLIVLLLSLIFLFVVPVHASFYVYVQSSSVTLSGWTNPAYAYNNVTTTGATNTTSSASFWTGYLILNFSDTVMGTKIQYMVGRSSSSSTFTTMEITVANQTGSWFTAYNATPSYSATTYVNATFALTSYSAMRYRFYKSTGTSSRTVTLYETQGIDDRLRLAYSPNETMKTSGQTVKATENQFSSQGQQTLLSVISPYIVDRPYSILETQTISGLNSLGFERGFSHVNAVTMSTVIASSVERIFADSGATSIVSSIISNIEKKFSSSGTSVLSGLLSSSGVERSFRPMGIISVSSFSVKGTENAFSSPSILNIGSSLLKSSENFFVSRNIIQVNPTVLQGVERGFLSSGAVNIVSSMKKAVENAFNPVSTMSVNGFVVKSVEKLFVAPNSLTLTPLTFQMKELGYVKTETVLMPSLNSFAKQVTSQAQEYSFTVMEIASILSSRISALETQYAPSNVMQFPSAIAVGTETGFLSSNTLWILMSSSVGSEKGFSVSEILKTLGSSTSGIEIGFGLSDPLSLFDFQSGFGEITLSPPLSFGHGRAPLGSERVSLDPSQPNGGMLGLQPITFVQAYLPMVVSDLKSLYTFLFTLSYPAHIQIVCVPPQTSTVNVEAVTVVMVPSLNYTETLTQTLNGSQPVTEDVTVPLPLLTQQTYDYHVSTTYLYGNTLIGQVSTDGTLMVQWWWVWMWAGTVATMILVFIGSCVGVYKLRERKRKKAEMQKTIRQQRHEIVNLRNHVR
jgi:hypothetical protein